MVFAWVPDSEVTRFVNGMAAAHVVAAEYDRGGDEVLRVFNPKASWQVRGLPRAVVMLDECRPRS